jgi:hypothetical protein
MQPSRSTQETTQEVVWISAAIARIGKVSFRNNAADLRRHSCFESG